MKIKNILIFLGFFLLLLTTPLWADSSKAVLQGSIITAIDIEGYEVVSPEVIYDEILTRRGEPFLAERVKNDLRAIYSLGYFSDVNVRFDAYDDGIKVVFVVSENPVINKVILLGNTIYSTNEIVVSLKNRPGRILEYKKLQDDIKTIEKMYQAQGYILAKVIDVYHDEKSRNLEIQIMEGIIESIELEGNETTLDYVILRELETEAGKPLNQKVLKKDLRRIFNLGFFSKVDPLFGAGTTPDKVLLKLRIKESRTGSINFGGGYGERQGLFAFTDFSIKNLFGTGQAILLKGQFGENLQTYQIRYYYPWLFPDRLGKRVSFTGKRWYTIGRDIYTSSQYDEVRNGWEVSFLKPFSDWFKGTINLGSENVAPSANSTTTFEAYTANTIGGTLSYDTRDSWLNPTEGELYTLSLRHGWKNSATAATTFTKYGLELNRFFSLAPSQTLAFHAGLGLGRGDVPISELYWAGGPNTVRGYYVSEIRTGIKKLIFNVEYRYFFNEVFQGVLFYDLGNAWDSGGGDLNDFLSGKGIGIRVNTPMGPIRLDYGIGKYRDISEGVTHFSIGHTF